MSLIEKVGRGLLKLYIKTLARLGEIRDTPENIAKGFATGVAISFTPFVGFHLLIALSIGKIFNQNGVAATLGTIAGNPWTFPLIWYLTFNCGKIMLEYPTAEIPENFSIFFKEIFHMVIMLDFKGFFDDIWPVFYPMLIGCIPFYIGMWWLSYITLRNVLQKKGRQRRPLK